MFRLAPLVSLTAAFSDETSLIQGLKPQPTPQKEDKSKAISNLLQSATQMLKNGVTPDVVEFARETLTEITGTVLPAITDASATDQILVTSTHALFESEVLVPLRLGQSQVDGLAADQATLSTAHKDCRAEEETACGLKRECDYDLYEKWLDFVSEETTFREYSTDIELQFCAEDANGTTWIFRDQAVAKFPRWIDQKTTVENRELAYDGHVQTCEDYFTALDDKTALCDADQLALERKACDHANKVIDVTNAFTAAWASVADSYQRVINEVHCLEIDRWKEWRTLTTIQCLLDRTTERNGRPCDEETNEVGDIVGACTSLQETTNIDHLRITYHEVPYRPNPPYQPAAPCSDAWVTQEYADLWTPPQPEFHANGNERDGWNSHCNQREECQECYLGSLTTQCVSELEHPSNPNIPVLGDSTCAQVTLDQLAEGEFDANNDGHFTDGHTGVRSNDIDITQGIATPSDEARGHFD